MPKPRKPAAEEPPKAVKALSVQQADSLYEFVRNSYVSEVERFVAIRDACILILMLDAGLRIGEVVQLVCDDLIFAARPVETLTVRAEIAKGHHRRDIPTSWRVRKCVASLEQTVWTRAGLAGTDYAFAGTKPRSHISIRQVQRMVERAGKIGLGVPVHPHMLRHTFATILMTKTSIRVVQQLLGHQSLQSTQVYTHPNSTDLQNAIDKAHPLPDYR